MRIRWIASMLIPACGAVQAAIPVQPTPPVSAEPAYFKTGVLTLQDRIWAQTQIERVFYNHRIWPKENTGPKPPFVTTVPLALIEKKAAEPIRMAAALKQYWNIEFTPAMLQMELDRMERGSKDRATLHELFTALHNDPYLLAETLARSSLTEKTLRHHYAWGAALHSAARHRAEEMAVKMRNGAGWSGLGATYSRRRMQREGLSDEEQSVAYAQEQVDVIRLSGKDFLSLHERLANRDPGSFREDESGYLFERMISENNGSLEMESLFIPKRPFEEWWAQASLNPTAVTMPATAEQPAFRLPSSGLITPGGCDLWNRMTSPPPTARFGHTAVWTGSEMIIWGGNNGLYLNNGGRYSPATDSWRSTSIDVFNTPSGRSLHSAVWSGTEIIVWGGYNGSSYLDTGARYLPSSDSWLPLTSANPPAARRSHTAVWTGGEMIIWGGYNGSYLNSGGRYSYSIGSWLATSLGANVPAGRSFHSAVWTGSEMIVWGGFNSPADYNNGGRYDPATDSWSPTSLGANTPVARYHHTAVWTGSEMIVWGGYHSPAYLNSGGRYSPATDSWLPTSTGANDPSGRAYHSAVWTGNEMIVWGGNDGAYLNTGGRYSPLSDGWLSTSTGVNAPEARDSHTAIWTGSEMIVWGGIGGSYLDSGVRYTPAIDSWLPVTTGPNIMARRDAYTAVWTGSEMIVWGGTNAGYFNNGGRYNPATDSWLPTSTGANDPSGRAYHSAVWTGNEMIVWGGYNGSYLNSGGRYNPVGDSWQPTSIGANVPAGRSDHIAVWTGGEMIVWGGGNGMNTGGRYDPATDTWRPTSIGVNVPIGRAAPTVVWTGSEMILWGGNSGLGPASNFVNSGGRYIPATNSWLPTSAGANLPSPRAYHTAVWTGDEMVVWGGYNITNFITYYFNDGGRYNPATDSWTPTSTGNAPAARFHHSAVWTGNEMIIWGGHFVNTSLNSGGRYKPASDNWLDTSIGVNSPMPMRDHTAVWTGSEMIVWGGNYSNYLNNGGIYTSGSVRSPGNSLRGGKSAGVVLLNWSSVSGASSYYVRRCDSTGGSCIPGTIVSTPTIPQYGEADNVTSYFYAVEAVNACGATP